MLIILGLYFLFSCQNRENLMDRQPKKDTIVNMGSSSSQFQEELEDQNLIRELSDKVTIHGDTVAFKHLQSIYVFSGHEDEFFYYTYIMAEQFEYPEAYYENYFILKTDIRNDSNKRRNAIADYYLLKAYESGYPSAIYSVKKRFNTSTPPKADEYWKTINK